MVQFVTPSLDGSILAGITRMSVIDFLRHKGYEVVERPIAIDEVDRSVKERSVRRGVWHGNGCGDCDDPRDWIQRG